MPGKEDQDAASDIALRCPDQEKDLKRSLATSLCAAKDVASDVARRR